MQIIDIIVNFLQGVSCITSQFQVYSPCIIGPGGRRCSQEMFLPKLKLGEMFLPSLNYATLFCCWTKKDLFHSNKANKILFDIYVFGTCKTWEKLMVGFNYATMLFPLEKHPNTTIRVQNHRDSRFGNCQSFVNKSSGQCA